MALTCRQMEDKWLAWVSQKLRPQHPPWKHRGLRILTSHTWEGKQLLWNGDQERTGLAANTTFYFIIQHTTDKDFLPGVPGIPATRLGSCVNNCSFPGLSQKARPLKRPPQLPLPRSWSFIAACTTACGQVYSAEAPPSKQSEFLVRNKHSHMLVNTSKSPPQSPFLAKSSANPRVSGQEEYHQTNGSCICSTVKHEQLVSPGEFTVACPK